MVVSSPATRYSGLARRASRAIALSLPPLQQKRTGSDAVLHAAAEFAAQGGESGNELVLAVEQVQHAAEELHTVSQGVTSGDVEARVGGSPREPQSQKIRVGARAAVVAGKIEIKPAVGRVGRQAARVQWTAQQAVAGNLRRIRGVGSIDDQAVVVGIARGDAQPPRRFRLRVQV